MERSVLYPSTLRSVNELEDDVGDSLRITAPQNQSIGAKNTLVGVRKWIIDVLSDIEMFRQIAVFTLRLGWSFPGLDDWGMKSLDCTLGSADKPPAIAFRRLEMKANRDCATTIPSFRANIDHSSFCGLPHHHSREGQEAYAQRGSSCPLPHVWRGSGREVRTQHGTAPYRAAS
jgi:hypothetical protein